MENHVSVLRRHLDGVGRGRDLVVTDPGGYRVAAERIDLDLDRFDERITAAGKAGTRMARKLLSEAVQARAVLARARGEVLEDEPYAEWADELRRTYRARLLGVHLDAAESALAERDTRSAIDRQKTLDFGAMEFVDLENDALEDVSAVDLVFDVIGGDIQKRSAGVIRAGGTLVTIAGPPEARPADGLAIDFVVASGRAQRGEIVRRVREGRLRTNIGNIATLDDAVAAFNPTERISGQTIIRVRP